jgi:hypothetical protein
MLFDLRGKRRRRGVQAVYLTLAVLMGGGLVFFGIGGATGGGLLDAINGGSGSSSVDTKTYEKKVAQLQAKVALSPKDPIPLASLTRAQFQQANVTGFDSTTNRYTAKGQALLQDAATTWQKYLALDPKKVDSGVAALMVQAYGGSGLNDTRGSVEALQAQIAGQGPSSGLYSQLAILAYLDGNTRQSALAERRALALAPARRHKIISATINQQRKQIDQAKLTTAATKIQQQRARSQTSTSSSGSLTPGG